MDKGAKKIKSIFQYDHASRKCEFPDCVRLAHTQGKQHADGSLYRRAWCKYHLRGKGKSERLEYAKDKNKYKPRKLRNLSPTKGNEELNK